MELRSDSKVATEPRPVGSTPFTDRCVLVTGGTGGVGLEVAELLARGGARVVVNGRDLARGEAAVDRLRQFADEVYFEAGDCSSYEEASRVVVRTVQGLGGIDILVSAGGEGAVGPVPFADATVDQLKDSLMSRVLPRLLPVHAAIGALRESSGSVVLLTSDAGRHPTPGQSMIGAASAGIMMATKVLAKELAGWGIRVNAVALTLTSGTPGWDRAFDQPGFSRELFTKALARFPQGRAPSAHEVARVVTFLASSESAQVTGQTMSVNGGLSFGGW